jgi:hypothetical protein
LEEFYWKKRISEFQNISQEERFFCLKKHLFPAKNVASRSFATATLFFDDISAILAAAFLLDEQLSN